MADGHTHSGGLGALAKAIDRGNLDVSPCTQRVQGSWGAALEPVGVSAHQGPQGPAVKLACVGSWGVRVPGLVVWARGGRIDTFGLLLQAKMHKSRNKG